MTGGRGHTPRISAKRYYIRVMNYRLTTVERAYQLAESGEFANVGEIKRRLST